MGVNKKDIREKQRERKREKDTQSMRRKWMDKFWLKRVLNNKQKGLIIGVEGAKRWMDENTEDNEHRQIELGGLKRGQEWHRNRRDTTFD